MDFCSCCKKRPPSTTFVPLQCVTMCNNPSQNAVKHHCLTEGSHTICSARKKKAIQSWKEEHFPRPSSTVCGTIAFKGDTRQALAECVYLYQSELEDVASGFNEDILKAVFEQLMKGIWDIPHPNCIVSVTGGAMNFDVDEEILNDFKDTIRSISRMSGAWVITGGTHAGIVKHVSNALKDESNPICIGISVFGKISKKDQLKGNQQNNEAAVEELLSYDTGSLMKAEGAYLDCCHSHFIMYDDGQVEEYGGEIRFRAALENRIAIDSGKPYILFAVGGGKDTVQTICETINYGHQVVLVKGSGGATDHIAEVIENGNSEVLSEEILSKVENYQDKLNSWRQKSHLFTMAGKDGKRSIGDAVTQSLMSAYSENKERLRLALLWQDTSTLAEIIPINSRSDKVAEDLQRLLVLALARGNIAFIKTLLFEYEVAIDVLNLDVLKLLYGYQYHEKAFLKKCKDKVKDEDFEAIVSLDNASKVKTDFAEYVYDYSQKCSFDIHKDLLLSRDGILKARKKFCTSCPEESIRDHPLWELFMWAVVCNLPDVAMVLWPLGQDQMGKALIASNYFGKVATEYERLAINDYETITHRKNNEAFTKLACHLLDECHKKNEERATKIVRQPLDFLDSGKTSLELAVMYKNHDFVANTSVQKVLTDVWAGNLDIRQVNNTMGMLLVLLVIFFPFLMPFVKFNKEELDNKGNKWIPKCIQACIWKIRHFYSAPVVGFLLNLVFQIAFAILYSYMLMVEGRKMDIEISIECMILYTMVAGYLTTELYQISQYDEIDVRDKIRIWFLDWGSLNSWDVFNLVLFITAVSLNRAFIETCHHSNHTNYSNLTNLYATANATANATSNTTANGTNIGNKIDYNNICGVPHTLHSINCACWILRITTALRVFPRFGEYYEMVKLMLADLLGFLLGMVFIILAYGVFSTSILHPNGEVKDMDRRFISLFVKPWFHIYGEFFIEHAKSTESSFSSFIGGKKSRTYEDYLVWVALGIYLCITNIVLLNILIAVFNNTYTKVIAKGTKIWRFNRYQVIVEYMNRCTSPPPLCILQHIFLLLKFMCGYTNLTSTSKKMDSKTSVQMWNLCEAEKIMLSQFQCDRALHIFKKDMEIIDGKVVMREVDDQMKNDAMLQTLQEQNKRMEEQMNKIVEQSRKIEDQNKKIDDQNEKMDGLKTLKEMIEKQTKIIIEHSTRAEDEQNKRAEDQMNKIVEQSRKIDDQNKKIDEQNKMKDELKTLKEMIEKKNKIIIEHSTRAEEQNKRMGEQMNKIVEQSRKIGDQNKKIDEQNQKMDELQTLKEMIEKQTTIIIEQNKRMEEQMNKIVEQSRKIDGQHKK